MASTLMTQLYPEIARFLAAREAEFDQIPESRRAELKLLADYMRDHLRDHSVARLTFICTHNSRRSHLSQIWAKVAADACGHTGVQTFSGGTEATAMNARVVQSLKRTGFKIESDASKSSNPLYSVSYSDSLTPLECFSKVYDESPNPTEGFCAVMTCSNADEACPVVPGSDLRLPIRYEDPKVADDTPEEAATYDKRSRQICREMFYAMKQV